MLFAGVSAGKAEFDIFGYDSLTTYKATFGNRFTSLLGGELVYHLMGKFNLSSGPGT